MSGAEKWIRWFRDIRLSDLPSVGGKNASLGELYNELTPRGISVPYGFAITVNVYHRLLDTNSLREQLQGILEHASGDGAEISTAAARARQAILSTPISPEIQEAILNAYRELSYTFKEPHTDVAVRSSATAEDLPEASFAGQQETYLNVRGEKAILEACHKCLASLFTARAVSYRNKFHFDHLKLGISVGVQKMIRSDLASSGVMFSIDTESGFPDVVLIDSSFGLGENVVQGSVNPDEFTVFKPTLAQGFRPIIRKELGQKELKLVYDLSGEKQTKNIPTTAPERAAFSLSNDEILALARWAVLIEDHYSEKLKKKTPMDIEWAKDGVSGQLHVVQARPETVQSRKAPSSLRSYRLVQKTKPLIQGHSVGDKIGQGVVRIIRDLTQKELLQPGEILVTDNTDPDWEPIIKLASAVVTNRGGRTCHAAIVSRELGIPAVVGTLQATEILHDAQSVTVSCAEGEVGKIYDGTLPFLIEEFSLKELKKPRTKIMLNIANPDMAFSYSFLPNEGVGLAREEFIISDYVKIHPLALVHFDKLKDPLAIEKIAKITEGYRDKSQFFVDKLAEGAGTIAAAFYPKDVIVRLSDFKTNEYTHLLGGKQFESNEENPMLGFRGAIRYYHQNYSEGFALECRALRKVRDEMGLRNLKVMVPFCRTPEEGKKVIQEMEKNGLVRGQHGLEVYVMCEIPSNVILAEEFADIFDGFSIGSNDLTQLVLGVDRNSATVAELFNERNPAVLRMISHVIRVAKSRGRKIGICGQAPSDYPDFAAFLVHEGIDSISLNPDSVLRTIQIILDAEQERKIA